ncbi:MAG: sulfurtransferase-like selenium metabolism protein YedF [Nitrospirae bacterium]|nr:sulfurtransferase-like selenium metabolism protein YedF [Nitrospirota bacterium]
MLVDARGFGCPKPVMMAEEALSKINEGLVEILLDNEASVKNVARFATKNGFYSETFKENNYWNVKIVKGYPCELPPEEKKPVKGTEKELCLIIASDTMGKEKELGKILMKAFFETIIAYKEFPTTIFFLNTGVKLTTLNEEILPILKDLEKKGVEIFSCGTCLKYFNLESELKVGYRGTTNHLLEGVKDFKKTVWIG